MLTHIESVLRQRRSPRQPRRRSASRASCVPARPPRVLLVEDNDINALLARRMLEKAGCEVSVCVNGREAVEAVRQRLAGLDAPFDLVLMDVHMPVLDGLEATRAIKQLYAVQRARPQVRRRSWP